MGGNPRRAASPTTSSGDASADAAWLLQFAQVEVHVGRHRGERGPRSQIGSGSQLPVADQQPAASREATAWPLSAAHRQRPRDAAVATWPHSEFERARSSLPIVPCPARRLSAPRPRFH